MEIYLFSYPVDQGSGTRVDWPLNNGRKVVLILPPDLTTQEAETIKQLVELRVVKEESSNET